MIRDEVAACAAPSHMHDQPLLLLFVQICIILAASRATGLVFRRLGQPIVIGEMLAGILLGPSLLGFASPHLFQTLFPADSIPNLALLSQIGVVFFLFLVGLELDPALLRSQDKPAFVISQVSVIAPFALGAALTFLIYPRIFTDPRPSFRSVALFMGAAMSVTAFPVLARILTERNLHKTKVGAIAITCAAINDAAAWCMLAAVVAVARLQSLSAAATTTGLAALYILVMFFGVRPFLRKLEHLHEQKGRLGQNMIAAILFLVLLSAAVTQIIGIHALFGAFLMGCIMPKRTQFVRQLAEKIEDFTVVLLLPIFFAYSGLRTHLGLIGGAALWLETILIIFVACLGKFGASALAARACGFPWRQASAIGILMNTRGLMELVILNVGREVGVINDALFAMMVVMAIVTTAMTSPILSLVYPSRLQLAKAAAVWHRAYSILIPVSLPKSGGPLVQLAAAILGPDRTRGRVYALHLRPISEHEAYRSGLGEPAAPSTPEDQAIAPLLAQARARSLPVEAIAFASADVAADIAATAAARDADLVLMGFHNPVFGRSLLGGTVHRVLTHCPAHVAIFIDRGLRSAGRILVPYLGSGHDRLALELAGRIARNTAAQVQVLHVFPPMRQDAARIEEARALVGRLFEGAGASAAFSVVEDVSPVGVILHQARQFDLVIIGVSEEWGLESRLFGWRPETIARDCPASMLIVRQHAPAGSAASVRAEPDSPPVQPPSQSPVMP